MKYDHDGTSGTADGRTRDRVVRLLLEGGSATAAELSRQLGVSPAAIRRHLDAMVADGIITPTESRSRGPRGRGRPARRYALTEAGHQAGPNAYSDLAAGALHFLAEVGGASAVTQFADTRAVDLERRVREAVVAAEPADRPAALAEAMTAAGYTASVSELPTGLQICQHHCPVQFVAERFPALCDAETAVLARVLDTHVQRLATIAHGDGVCTTHIPAGHPPAGHPPAGHTAVSHTAADHPPAGTAPGMASRARSDRNGSDQSGSGKDGSARVLPDSAVAGSGPARPASLACPPSSSSEGFAL
ncbi:ArsR family transcriptional regulator [Frankia sp. B2]|nr:MULTISPECIES: helix-turn-helix domain-containing protein [unclassified Frankia]ETA00955.1 putative transcriptional regulator [Frankia sp. CcI6]KDA41945.1 putative transcriptional regulator [Frankia sp. BMG5.23]KFB05914.1 putative transcriptional regulator [Frankia sp. Allo2]OFB45310.1 transcriptional regulator [Frankia sp. CgIM4]OHV57847.1 transcriptional regulator [Frankia sp. CgIS1]